MDTTHLLKKMVKIGNFACETFSRGIVGLR